MTAPSRGGTDAPIEAGPEDAGLSRAERVYRHLRAGIRAGAYRPGQRLRETQLAAALDTSRTPVREAIRRLEADRLVEDVPGRGLAVARLDQDRVRELYQFRMAIEGAAAEMAALHATALDIAELSDLLEQMRTAAGDSARAAHLNRRFHEGIYRAARNSFLSHAIAAMTDFMALLPGTTYALPGRAAEVVEEHERVLRAIAERDPEEAARAVRAHIQKAAQFRLRMTGAEELAGVTTAG
ncbi:GntR family transcriptional regulator [Falsiroseomonas bella]|uniref:GntR family transcriptional regulator n=1 Tax=Falsiroseomonas bella TaxID=2184016 RepID=UPI001304FCB5|nr:GntR family transcriptional regulator [Falsiroseomonas bella]